MCLYLCFHEASSPEKHNALLTIAENIVRRRGALCSHGGEKREDAAARGETLDLGDARAKLLKLQ